MIDTMRLSLRLLRRHLSLYAGCMVTLSATAMVAAAQGGLIEALSHPKDVRIAGLSSDEVAAQLVAFRGLLSVLSGLVIVTSGFLMWSAVKQVVSFRQRELALMRLVGAGRWRLAWMVCLECSAMGFAVALPSAIVGALLTRPLFMGLQAIGFFGSGVDIRFGFAPVAVVLIVGLVTVTASVAGLFATRSATRGDLMSAISPTVVPLSRAQIVWRGVIALIGLACIAFLDAQAMGPNLILALPLLAVVPLFALAPLVVPAGAWLVGRCVGLVAPGPGVLAAQRASKDRVRFARMATPLIVSVGVLGGFFVANAPDEQLRAETYNARVAASVVASGIGVPQADRAAEALGSPDGSVARLASQKRTVSEVTRVLYFTDAVSLADLLTQSVTAGDLRAVDGLGVASSISGAQVGDSLTTLDVSGRPVTLNVTAVVDDPLFEGVFIDWAQTGRFASDTRNLPVQVFASRIDQPAAQEAIRDAGVTATVVDRGGYIQQLEDARRANTYRSNIGIFGTVYLMCVISLVQFAVSGNLARRREFGVLRSLGVGRGGILQTVGAEAVIVQVVGGVLIAAVLVTLGLRFASLNGTSAPAAILSVTPVTGLAFAAVALVAIVAQLFGGSLALAQVPGDADVPRSAEELPV